MKHELPQQSPVYYNPAAQINNVPYPFKEGKTRAGQKPLSKNDALQKVRKDIYEFQHFFQ
jgi:hypothetical protein